MQDQFVKRKKNIYTWSVNLPFFNIDYVRVLYF